MAAKNVSKAVSMAVEPFEKIGKQVGSLASSLPKYTPLPIPGGSIAGASKAVSLWESAIASASDKRFADSGIGKMLNADKHISADRDKKIVDAINGSDKTIFQREIKEDGSKEYAYKAEFVKAFMDKLKWMKDWSEREEYLRKMGITESTSQNAIIEFAKDSTKSNLRTDQEKKEFLALINKWVGNGSGPNNDPKWKTGTFVKTWTPGSESININIWSETKASIDVKTAKISNLTDEVKTHLKENVTIDDLKQSINSLPLADQNKIIVAVKDLLKTKA